MSENLKKKIYIFDLISKIKKKKLRNQVLNEFSRDDSFFSALKEIATNVIKGRLKGKININSKKRVRLNSIKADLIKLANIKKPKKKVITNLKGGFWTYLIPIVLELFRRI